MKSTKPESQWWFPVSETSPKSNNFPVDENGDWDWRNDRDRNPALQRQTKGDKNFGVWSCLGWCFFKDGTIKGTEEDANQLLADMRLLHPGVQYEVRVHQ
jgi:iron uptake system EfeUOB component EfeO/EfeM